MSIYYTLYSVSPSTDIRFGKRRWPWYLFSNAMLNMGCTLIPGGNSNLAALHPTICNTLNGPTYWGHSFPGLSFSFKCFVDNSTLSPELMFDFLLIIFCEFYQLTACQLLLTLQASYGHWSISFIGPTGNPPQQMFTLVIL